MLAASRLRKLRGWQLQSLELREHCMLEWVDVGCIPERLVCCEGKQTLCLLCDAQVIDLLGIAALDCA